MQKLIIIGLLITLLMSGCDFIKKVNPFARQEDNMEEYHQRQDSLRRAELLIKQRQEALREQAKADSIRQAREAEAEAESIRTLNRYHLIVGAFKTPSYARDFNEKIIARGYDSKIIQSDNSFNLVTMKSFDNYRTAVNEWKAIRNEGEHLVWLYIKDD